MGALRTVKLDDAAPQPWRNGGGTTRELLTWPAAEGWRLRVSVARIERDGPFSAYAGIERWFAVLEGAGVQLAWPGRAAQLTPDGEPLRFDGAEAPDCRLIDGPTDDLNLMLRGAAGAIEPAAPRTPWTRPARWRAVFTATACSLQADARYDLAPGTLAWADAGDSPPWHLEATDAPLRAWWLHARA